VRHSFDTLILFAALLVSCNSSRQITPTDLVAVEQVAHETETREAMIVLTNGSSSYGYFVRVRSDTTEWYAKDRSHRTAVSSDRINWISVSEPALTSGLEYGLLVGALPALAIGVLTAFATDYAEHPLGNSSSASDRRAVNLAFWEGFLATETFAAGIGAGVGSNHRTVYHFR
jgi:hypothetical protein